jgi:hypothetical protein
MQKNLFQGVTSFNKIERQQCILIICYLRVQNKEEDGSSRFLQNISLFLQEHTVIHSGKRHPQCLFFYKNTRRYTSETGTLTVSFPYFY